MLVTGNQRPPPEATFLRRTLAALLAKNRLREELGDNSVYGGKMR
jgi:hypothetical protein